MGQRVLSAASHSTVSPKPRQSYVALQVHANRCLFNNSSNSDCDSNSNSNNHRWMNMHQSSCNAPTLDKDLEWSEMF